MRRAAAFCLILCTSWAYAQWVEATIPVGRSPAAICWQPAGNKVYACCYGSPEEPDSMLYVIDGETNAVLDSLPVVPWASALAVDVEQSRVYVGGLHGGVAVVDCASDSLELVVETPDRVWTLAYDSLGKKLYAGGTASLAIIDCLQDTLVAVLDSTAASVMEWDPVSGKLYCGGFNSDTLLVVDGPGDTVRARIALGFTVNDICRNPHSDMVYVGSDATYYSQLALVDAAADSLVRIDTLGFNAVRMAYNSLADDLYCTLDGNKIVVVDGVTNQVVRTLTTLNNEDAAVCYNPTSNKVYSTNYWEESIAYVIDGATREFIGQLDVGWGPFACCCNPASNRVYVANWDDNSVSVIRDTAVAGIAQEPGVPVKEAEYLPTILRGPVLARLDCRVIDALGRDVTDRRDRLAPGVYFLKDEGGRQKDEPGSRKAVQKVIVQR
jgi:DNA-binding beta-propeller fold protein YncE